MKILYGVQATGNGHISRARAVNRYLKERGADATWLFSGRPRQQLFEMESFGDFVHKEGLTFTVRNGEVRYLKTALDSRPVRFLGDVLTLDIDAYDLIVTDFEPVVAWAGRRAKRPVIGIGHQYAFNYDIPIDGDNFLARLIMKKFAPADVSLGLHWHHFNQPILPPIVDLDDCSPDYNDNKVVVYLPFENQAAVIELLRKFPEKEFFVYAPGLVRSSINNIQQRSLSVAGFKQDLAECAGVICNAGFELASEALRFGKNILVKPLHGQMEQLSNARALHVLGYGTVMEGLEPAIIGAWIRRLSPRQSIPFPNVAAAIADWLLAGNWHNPHGLVRTLWDSIAPGKAE